MCNEDVLVLVKATIILDLECVPSLQCLLVDVIPASDYAAGLVELEFPVIIITPIKCFNVSVCFCFTHNIVKLTHTSFSRVISIF